LENENKKKRLMISVFFTSTLGVVVTILSNTNKKYLSTDLTKEEPVKENYFSNDVDFLDYKAIRRQKLSIFSVIVFSFLISMNKRVCPELADWYHPFFIRKPIVYF
jgi:hypothetical protein